MGHIFQTSGPASSHLARRADTREFIDLLGSLVDIDVADGREAEATNPGLAPQQHQKQEELQAAKQLFRWDTALVVTRAPGRLDVMGGIADYSGSLVLQLPIAEACHVALQRQPVGQQRLWAHIPQRHAAKGGERPSLRIVSLQGDSAHRSPSFDIDLEELFSGDLAGGAPLTYADARARLTGGGAESRWAAYVAGCLVVLAREKGLRPLDGLSLLVSSRVPEGKGVSSSAAVEVASMSAMAAAYDVSLTGRELALLCQMAENLVVGAPCGVMDQMASALGREGQLLALLCQPAEVQRHVTLPPHVALWGVDSGVRHSVGGSDYGSVRVGAFMGLKIVNHLAGDGHADSASPLSIPYLASLSPSELRQRYEPHLPAALTGREFLEQYGPHVDHVTTVDPDTEYAVRIPSVHPVQENFRVRTFRQLLAAPRSEEQMQLLGELMLQSHESYSACALGSAGTERLVALVQDHMARRAGGVDGGGGRDDARAAGGSGELWGAKITGGGSGGTVCILGSAGSESESALKEVVDRYQHEAGHAPYVFQGSSPGAVAFGHLNVELKA